MEAFGGKDGGEFFLIGARLFEIAFQRAPQLPVAEQRQKARVGGRKFALEDDGGFHLRLRRRREPQGLAAGANCGRQRIGAAGHQDKQTVVGGLL